jgi:superfamily II DNA or RNA helicase
MKYNDITLQKDGIISNKKDCIISNKKEFIISKKGYSIKKNNFDNKFIDKIKKELTVKPFILSDYDDNSVSFPIYRESENYLYLPKFYGLSKFGQPDKNKLDEGESIDIDFKGEIRNNQIEAIDKSLKAFSTHGGGILSLPCGYGKTVISLNLISKLNVKTLVIVHKEFLLNQWKERATTFTNAKIGIIQQNKIDVDGYDIVIGMLQSISLKDYSKDIFSKFGLVIIDEVHHIGARVFSRALPIVFSKYMLGLSATPNRKDGLSKVFEYHIGDTFFSIKRKQITVVVNRLIIQCHDSNYSKIYYNMKGQSNLPKMINSIVDYKPRNKLILKILWHLYNSDRKVLVLSDRRGHLDYIYKSMINYSLFKLITNSSSLNKKITEIIVNRINTAKLSHICSCGFYIGGMKQKDLKNSESKNIILGTFMMAAEAMDIPGLDTVILSTPKGDIEQAVGRILRKETSEITPVVIDIVDNFSSFETQSKKRKTFYNKNDYQIYDFKTPLNNIKNIPKSLILEQNENYVKQKSKKNKIDCSMDIQNNILKYSEFNSSVCLID